MKYPRAHSLAGLLLLPLLFAACEIRSSDYRILVKTTVKNGAGKPAPLPSSELCLVLTYLYGMNDSVKAPVTRQAEHCEPVSFNLEGISEILFQGKLLQKPPFDGAIPMGDVKPVSFVALLKTGGVLRSFPLELRDIEQIDALDGSKAMGKYEIEYKID